MIPMWWQKSGQEDTIWKLLEGIDVGAVQSSVSTALTFLGLSHSSVLAPVVMVLVVFFMLVGLAQGPGANAPVKPEPAATPTPEVKPATPPEKTPPTNTA